MSTHKGRYISSALRIWQSQYIRILFLMGFQVGRDWKEITGSVHNGACYKNISAANSLCYSLQNNLRLQVAMHSRVGVNQNGKAHREFHTGFKSFAYMSNVKHWFGLRRSWNYNDPRHLGEVKINYFWREADLLYASSNSYEQFFTYNATYSPR